MRSPYEPDAQPPEARARCAERDPELWNLPRNSQRPSTADLARLYYAAGICAHCALRNPCYERGVRDEANGVHAGVPLAGGIPVTVDGFNGTSNNGGRPAGRSA